jgi:hypothetical protein
MKTAITWYLDRLTDLNVQLRDNKITLVEYTQKVKEAELEAKEMEKQKIIDAHTSGQSLICKQAADLFEHGIDMDDSEGVEIRDAENYFNETFKTEI